MLSRRFVALCVIVASALVFARCRPSPASAEGVPDDVHINLLATQSFDSLGVIVAWAAGDPPNARQYPIEGHNVEVREAVSDTVIAALYVTGALEDTLWMAMPPIGSTVQFYGAVNAQDTQGNTSGWVVSAPMTWITTPLEPNTPGGVSVDTVMGSLIIDSLRILNRDGFTVAVGDTTRFAAVLYSGVWPVECCCTKITDPPGTHPCDDVTLVTLGSVLPAKQPVYKYVTASRIDKLAPEGVLLRSWFINAWRSLRVG